MQRAQLEVAILAVAETTREREFVLAGSQSVHATTPDPPAEVLVSEECDVLPKGRFEQFQGVSKALGRNSSFHLAHGFYVDALEPGLLLLPQGWDSRLIPMRVKAATAWCLDPTDVVISKLNAGRLKDYEFVNAMIRTQLAQFEGLVRRIQKFPDPHLQSVLLARLRISTETMP